MAVLLKDAIKPNLVQTLEGTPAFIHGGPFANIAHGCSSIITTKMALKLGDYCVTEAGFGADLGAEKFLDIKCRKAEIKPDVVVLVATLKALKYHGGVQKEDIYEENEQAIIEGMQNLLKHIDNLRNKFNVNTIVAINKNDRDNSKELQLLEDILNKNNIEYSLVESWKKGGEGAIDIAEKIDKLSQNNKELNYAYELEDDIKTKIEKICTKIYGAKEVKYTEEAEKNIEKIEEMGYEDLPICIAKTQYSFSDDAKNLKCDEPFEFNIRNVELNAGAEFVVVLAGKILTMPGLSKKPAANNIDIDENENIIGIF